ncbi:pentatricopeptide repeat-containing protein At2g33680-like [Nymphaea colorata]|nr:pentatricopeptide repeat-containing protein At2g33680-like [Nymphaea colorata]XP_031488235.1 pentatricopeptide repeat-containing protein At2g33680-like [Nymphaea colorata]
MVSRLPTRDGLLLHHRQTHGMMRRFSFLSIPVLPSPYSLLRFARTQRFHSSSAHYLKSMSSIVSAARLFRNPKQLSEAPTFREVRMDDILAIMGPFDKLFPYSYMGGSYIGLIRKFMKMDAFLKCVCLHVHVIKLGFAADIMVSNVIMDVYVKNELLMDGHQVFIEMPTRDLVSWCTLIAGYANAGIGLDGLDLFRCMWRSGLRPNQFVFASVLKAVSACGCVRVGRQVHSQIFQMGFVSDGFLVIGLVNMYAKCGEIICAREVFDEAGVRNSISWNAMISGYIQNGLVHEGLVLYEDMRSSGSAIDVVTMRIVLGAAVGLEQIDLCNNLHAYAIKTGLESDKVVVTELLRSQAEIGELMAVHELLKSLKDPDGSAFSAITSGLQMHGYSAELLKLARKLLESGVKMNQGALICMLGLCFRPKEGAQVHTYTFKIGYLSDISVANAVVSMYARCGEMDNADAVFHGMARHDLVSWTAIISGHVQNLQFWEAINLFHSYSNMGLPKDQFLIATIINASAGLLDVDLGKQIHAIVLKLGLQHFNFLQTSILHMYAVCGFLETADMLFSSMLLHDMVSINVMLVCYCRHGQADRALDLFYSEHQKGLAPDQFSISAIFLACADLKSMAVGEQVHSYIIKSGLTSDFVIGNAVVNFYVKCNSIASACNYLGGLKLQDVGTFGMIISGYVQSGNCKEALRLFCAMHCGGLRANHYVFASILRGCTTLFALEEGRQVHASIIKVGLNKIMQVGNSLVDMYAKSFCMNEAEKVFDEMSAQDDVSWNALIRGYSQTGEGDKAFELFEMMKQEEVYPDCFSYVGILSACAGAVSLKKGSSVHACVVQNGLEQDVSIGNALVDMYAKCGSIKDAWKVFERMSSRNVISWNAMVTGCAQHGHADEALDLFQKMQQVGMTPDHITYIAVLSACSRVGLVDEGISHFGSMTDEHGVVAVEEHYACMVDILSRAGWLDEAHGFINEMPVQPTGIMWRTLLAASKSHGNTELGAKAAHRVLDRSMNDSASHVLLSNIYAMSEKWVNVKFVRDDMRNKGVKKEPGCSWIEIDDGVDIFFIKRSRSEHLGLIS